MGLPELLLQDKRNVPLPAQTRQWQIPTSGIWAFQPSIDR
jgi:hypothetical protein